MTVAPPEPALPEEDQPSKPESPDLPDPAFPEVLPDAEPGTEPDRQPPPPEDVGQVTGTIGRFTPSGAHILVGCRLVGVTIRGVRR